MPVATVADDQASRSVPYPTADQKRRKLRVAIITENFLPKVDGVTRTLARLLEHLNSEGHEAIVFGPETGVRSYAGHDIVGTFGLPLVVYPGLKLNFMRPRFIRRLQQFKPDVIHFVDPIWLGAQMLPVVQRWLPLVPCVSSYHTNLPTYATLFGMPWLEETMWNLTRNLHSRCQMVFCPSESTRRMLQSKGFENVEIWSRGVDTSLFTPAARDDALRSSWGCTPTPSDIKTNLSKSEAEEFALVQIASKLGVQVPRTSPVLQRRRSLFGATTVGQEDESFIRTPPAGPSLVATPELSPPPSYDSVAGVPDLPAGSFSLPPPAIIQSSTNRDEENILSSSPSKAVILYVGRISWEKNIRLLIEAFRLLPAPIRANAKLVLVGDGPARGDLTRLCNRHGLDATFMGHQKGKRLAAMYASASVFAFPSFTETFGQVVLEALASGLPVVGLHAEGTSDLVTHGRTGLLLDVKAAVSGTGHVSSPTLHARSSPRLAAMARESDNKSTMTDFVEAANSAVARLRPSMERRTSSAKGTGLSTSIPSIGEFATLMSSNSTTFTASARSYSMLLERLIQDRTLRTAMGQRAQISAARRTWWDAMDAVVRGYETSVANAGIANLSDEELEALRREQQKKAPLTGPLVKVLVLSYMMIIALMYYMIFP